MINKLEFCNILLCTDYSQDADAAFIHAFDQAKKYRAVQLEIVHKVNSLFGYTRKRGNFKKSDQGGWTFN
jgi:hypothetical protein